MRITTRKLVYGALLLALAIIAKRLFYQFNFAGGAMQRLSLYYPMVMLSGMLLGPMMGALIGIASDLFGMLLFPTGIFNPFLTLSITLVGVIPGLIYKKDLLRRVKYRSFIKLIATVVSVQCLCSILISSVGMAFIFSTAGFFSVEEIRPVLPIIISRLPAQPLSMAVNTAVLLPLTYALSPLKARLVSEG